MLLDVREELREEFLGSNQPVTEDASYGQIVGQGLGRAVMRRLPARDGRSFAERRG